MSETQRTLFTQCVNGLLMAGALLLVAIYSGRHRVETGNALHTGAAMHTHATDRFLTSLGGTATSGSNEGPPAEKWM